MLGTITLDVLEGADCSPSTSTRWAKIPDPLIRLGSNSTMTPEGWTSWTKLPAKAAEAEEMWAVPNKYTTREPFFHTETLGSQLLAVEINSAAPTGGTTGEAHPEAISPAVAAVTPANQSRREEAEEGEVSSESLRGLTLDRDDCVA